MAHTRTHAAAPFSSLVKRNVAGAALLSTMLLLAACGEAGGGAGKLAGSPGTTAASSPPSPSNIENSTTTLAPVPAATFGIPDGLLGIDDAGDVVEYRQGTWDVRYDGAAWDTDDATIQSWASSVVRSRDSLLVGLCCEPVAGITVDPDTLEAPFYGEVRAAVGSRVGVIDWTSGVRIHEGAGLTKEVAFAELVEAGETESGGPRAALSDVRLTGAGGVVALWSSGPVWSVSHLTAEDIDTANGGVILLRDLDVLWQGTFGIAWLASAPSEAVDASVWVFSSRLDGGGAELHRVPIDGSGGGSSVVPLPENWPTGPTVVFGERLAVASGVDAMHLLRLADREAVVVTGAPSLLWIG